MIKCLKPLRLVTWTTKYIKENIPEQFIKGNTNFLFCDQQDWVTQIRVEVELVSQLKAKAVCQDILRGIPDNKFQHLRQNNKYIVYGENLLTTLFEQTNNDKNRQHY